MNNSTAVALIVLALILFVLGGRYLDILEAERTCVEQVEQAP